MARYLLISTMESDGGWTVRLREKSQARPGVGRASSAVRALARRVGAGQSRATAQIHEKQLSCFSLPQPGFGVREVDSVPRNVKRFFRPARSRARPGSRVRRWTP